MARLTIASMRSGEMHIHRADCADLKRRAEYRVTNSTWTGEFATEEDLAFDIWDDIASDEFAKGTDEHRTQVMEYHASEDRVFPCVTF